MRLRKTSCTLKNAGRFVFPVFVNFSFLSKILLWNRQRFFIQLRLCHSLVRQECYGAGWQWTVGSRQWTVGSREISGQKTAAYADVLHLKGVGHLANSEPGIL